MILTINNLTSEQITRLKLALDADPILIELFQKELQHHQEVVLQTDLNDLHDPAKQNLMSQNQARYKEWTEIVKFLKNVRDVSMEELYAMTAPTES